MTGLRSVVVGYAVAAGLSGLLVLGQPRWTVAQEQSNKEQAEAASRALSQADVTGTERVQAEGVSVTLEATEQGGRANGVLSLKLGGNVSAALSLSAPFDATKQEEVDFLTLERLSGEASVKLVVSREAVFAFDEASLLPACAQANWLLSDDTRSLADELGLGPEAIERLRVTAPDPKSAKVADYLEFLLRVDLALANLGDVARAAPFDQDRASAIVEACRAWNATHPANVVVSEVIGEREFGDLLARCPGLGTSPQECPKLRKLRRDCPALSALLQKRPALKALLKQCPTFRELLDQHLAGRIHRPCSSVDLEATRSELAAKNALRAEGKARQWQLSDDALGQAIRSSVEKSLAARQEALKPVLTEALSAVGVISAEAVAERILGEFGSWPTLELENGLHVALHRQLGGRADAGQLAGIAANGARTAAETSFRTTLAVALAGLGDDDQVGAVAKAAWDAAAGGANEAGEEIVRKTAEAYLKSLANINALPAWIAADAGCSSQYLEQRIAVTPRGKERNRLFRLYRDGLPKLATASLGGDVTAQDFKWISSIPPGLDNTGSFALSKTTKHNTAVEAALSMYLRGFIPVIAVRATRSFEGSGAAQVCAPYPGSTSLRCTTAALAPPEREEGTVVEVSVKRFETPVFAWRVQLLYERERSTFNPHIFLYFLPQKGKGLRGGFDVSYVRHHPTEEDGLQARLFFGAPLAQL